MKGQISTIAAASLWVVAAANHASATDPYLNAPPYAKPVAPKTSERPIVTVGQSTALTDGSGEDFRFVGIPDGLGIYKIGSNPNDNRFVLLSNHEFNQTAGGPAGPLPSGARISELVVSLDPHGGARSEARRLVSGKYAIERVWAGEPPVQVDPVTRGIARFCSAFLADEAVGFDRNIFINGEETAGPGTFDPNGGQGWATFEGDAYALPRLGRSSWENFVVARGTGDKTVIFGLEDGPSSGDGANSQLFMYIGAKDPSSGYPLTINGLDNGALYVFVSDDPVAKSEVTFTNEGASIAGHWAPVDYTLSDTALDTAARNAGAFGFIRVEDGTNNPNQAGELYFVTTGKPSSANPYGRVYRLEFNPADPLAGASTLTLLVASTVNEVISPDNVDLNIHGELAICEDPVYDLSSLGLTRDTGLWIYNIATDQLELVAEIDRAAAKAHALAADPLNSNDPGSDTPGGWEFSGVIDAERFLGRGTWIANVQAHSLRINPVSETVEGGQIFLLRHITGGGLVVQDGPTHDGFVTERPARSGSSSLVTMGVSPNPVQGRTTLRFALASSATVEASVFAADGSRVRHLASGSLPIGEHAIEWNGADDAGRAVPSGVYFVRLNVPGETRDARVIVTR